MTIMAEPVVQTAPPPLTPATVIPPYLVPLAQSDAQFVTHSYYALSPGVDDAERALGVGLYERMMTDEVVAGVTSGIMDEVLSEPMRFVPCVEPPSPYGEVNPEHAARYEQAKRVADFVTYAIGAAAQKGLTWSDTLADLGKAMWFGHRMAEATYRVEVGGDYDGMLVLDSLRILPRSQYTIITDYAFGWLGALIKQPGKPAARSGPVPTPETDTNYVPREKLVLMSWDSVAGDPRGRSALRPAYTHWRKKQEYHPAEAKFVVQFGGGVVVAMMPENVPPSSPDPSDPTRMVKSSDSYLAAVSDLSSGKCAVFPHGTEVRRELPTNDGAAFEAAFRRANWGITMAISSNPRRFLESQFGSRADSGDAANGMNHRINRIRQWLCEGIRHQLVEVMVRLNFGRDVARDCLPVVVMSSGAQEDFASNSAAVAQLVREGAVTPAMRRQLAERKLGIEWIDDDEQDANRAPE